MDLGPMVKLTPDERTQRMQEAPSVFVPVSGSWGRRGSTNVRLAADEPMLPDRHSAARVTRRLCGRLCCKSRFALVIKNSAGYRRGFLVKM